MLLLTAHRDFRNIRKGGAMDAPYMFNKGGNTGQRRFMFLVSNAAHRRSPYKGSGKKACSSFGASTPA